MGVDAILGAVIYLALARGRFLYAKATYQCSCQSNLTLFHNYRLVGAHAADLVSQPEVVLTHETSSTGCF